MTIFIGGAWVYANGSLHLGHISSLLPGDILARYYRKKGERVLYVSGTDCNGTPIGIRAKQEGKKVKEIADRYHNEFLNNYEKLGFSYDAYGGTDSVEHHGVVQKVFLELLEKGYIYKKESKQLYCGECDNFLSDRYVEGNCPKCGDKTRGDQCDGCTTILEAGELVNKQCKLCKSEPVEKETEHFYFKLSEFEPYIKELLEQANQNKIWRTNALNETEEFIKNGLRDRAISRDLENGVPVPVEGYKQKKVYVWIEAVIGYLSASKLWEERTKESDVFFWQKDTKAYYVHGKDNIPFHTIIWPSVQKALGIETKPTIIANEYVTLEKKKISTSKNWAVWIPEFLKDYEPDSLRYFLTINAPEKGDADFSWQEFIRSHNAELLGAYGNLVNRTFKFVQTKFDGRIPLAQKDIDIGGRIDETYLSVGEKIEKGEIKKALEEVFELVRYGNKLFDEKQPWKTYVEDLQDCKATIAKVIQLIANIANLLEPFLPFSSQKIKEQLQIKQSHWGFVQFGQEELKKIEPLFERIDLSCIEDEKIKLQKQSKPRKQ